MGSAKYLALSFAVAGVLLVPQLPAFAQQPGSAAAETRNAASPGTAATVPTKSGFPEASSMEMGDSVTEDLAVDDVAVG